ncbi:MAG TPA: outer membrane beta-barrel protein [Acidobacteriaceae bacterium]|nr:outer membrane beta-barrel protein [Acidobacteriaceae bacterium]
MAKEVFSARMRFSYCCIFYAALAILLTGSTVPAVAQSSFLKNSEGSVGAFAEFTSNVSGNGVTLDTTKAAGGQAAFRHSYHWWLGFEGSYNYTRFNEYYSTKPYSIQHNMHEFAGSYLVTTPTSLFGFKPFAMAGVSAIVFSPSLNGGQNVPWQGRTGINFGAGVEHPLLSPYFGVRIEYRGVYYKAPDFNQPALNTGASRLTSEPLAGFYFHF